ncbi:TPA: DUF3265 domain-containing protein [Vibrio vulnificus]|nr:DUF3265 domain-containing protein [Vibrio vulnificus]HAS6244561.1 DUF3265 domain-containing protein [Vibrio vulnificus]HDY7947087.1 DUF3265 domain-containing protein [Vibrio vulnificus]
MRNAWQFWFAVSFVFTVQCGSFVLRCSLLNWALCVFPTPVYLLVLGY